MTAWWRIFFAMCAVVSGEMTVSSLRHRAWDPSTALHLAGPSRARKSRFATGTRMLLDALRHDLD